MESVVQLFLLITQTQELIPAAPRKRGRPSTGKAKSGAARQAAYLARKKNETVTVTFRRYRVGDYRVICEIRDDELVIVAVMIGHRSEVYGVASENGK